ncbi:putative membrane protein YeiB [Rubricella aquisinus]|uniref:Putative membrane protein YeiB n=1 Tax=Rubricella aquisinus TaxID=2028108 RepID=A0A840WKA7_9RHOB|nr:heparan-alpha-glucosaminide N-acetyltransferase domain-containing protein [Rubricella aquisinus]MBB5514102.1 putative membrane protein YeiB [Rubricella aquisinus]
MQSNRLIGLDIARFCALVGMIIVNFDVVVVRAGSPSSTLADLLQGRAAAMFVVLAGIGFALGMQRLAQREAIRRTLIRSAALMAIGLANMAIFPADIIHYYAVYFLAALPLLWARTYLIALLAATLPLLFVVLTDVFDYEAGWDWETLTYHGFWTIDGFARNLLFNGWHPVVPWLSFLLLGLMLARAPLAVPAVQMRMILGGLGVALIAELASFLLVGSIADPELAEILLTEPLPPGPLYSLAGSGWAVCAIGLCLRTAAALDRLHIARIILPAGQHTLTHYIAHIVIGMGTMEAFGRIGAGTGTEALIWAIAFSPMAVAASYLWSLRWRHGPFEGVVRALTR